jgi:hypothetical protein
VSGWQGSGLVNTFLRGDATTGTLTSPEFTLSAPYLNFLIGGGNHPSDSEAPTAVRLVVDGQVVRSATGKDSEALNWASWDVRDLAGRKARFEVVDANTGGWGHVLVDQVMNNWQYAGNIPTSPWRSAQSVLRQVGLRTIGEVELVQEPVRALDRLHRGAPFLLCDSTVHEGMRSLGRRAEGRTLDIEATFSPRDAERFGLKVLSGPGQETVIGYDTTTGELYVDRTRSGRTDFSPDFPAVQRAPLAAVNGKVTLRALVDWSSVEVFGCEGQAVITSQVFPDRTSDGVEVFAEGGKVRIDRLTIHDMGTYRR